MSPWQQTDINTCCLYDEQSVVPEQTPIIAQATDDGHAGGGLSLIKQPFDKIVEDSDTVEKMYL